MMNNKNDWATMLKGNTSIQEVIAAANAAPAKTKNSKAASALLPSMHVGRGTRYGNLTWFPIFTDSAVTDRSYVTNFDANLVKLAELDQASVGTVQIQNDTASKVILFEGTLLEGGWQHRALTRTVLVNANGVTDLPVVCVEQGRWGGTHVQRVGNRQAPAKVRSAMRGMAKNGSKFNQAFADQGRVWAGTEEKVPPILAPRLLLVDIENLCGEPRPHPKRISAAKKFLDALVGTDPSTDQYIIGCHHTIQKDVETVWRDSKANHWQLRVRSGKDGADIALGAWLKSNVAKLDAFNSLVIGSGDHFFADESFVRTAYLKFSPNHILQVASSPSSKSHKFEDFSHHVSYFSEVHPKPISLLREQEIDTASKRYAVLGRKLLGVKAFKDGRKSVSSEGALNQQPKVSFMRRILENTDADVPIDDFDTRMLLRDGMKFQFVNWFRQHDWEFNDKVYLSSETMERVELAQSGDNIVATDSEGIATIYIVS